MPKKILFPFSVEKNFHRGYSWTMELATRMNATPFFFTVLPNDTKPSKGRLRHVYHSLLEARGKYMQYFHRPGKAKAVPKSERLIEEGDFTWSLIRYVKKTKFDIIVVDLQASGLSPTTLHDVVENANSVIVLPDQLNTNVDPPETNGKASIGTQDFYDILGQSSLYKVPGNFFRILGKDKGLFNYLGGLFKNNRNPTGER